MEKRKIFMPHVSQRPISQELQQEILRNLFVSLTYLQNETQIESLLLNLLTPTEKIMLSKRLTAAFLIEHGYTYGQISEILKLSPTTVNIVNRELKKFGSGYRSAIKLIEAKREKNSKLFAILKKINKAAGIAN